MVMIILIIIIILFSWYLSLYYMQDTKHLAWIISYLYNHPDGEQRQETSSMIHFPKND